MTVGVVEPVGHLAGDAEGVLQGELPFPIQAAPQALALDVGHGEPEEGRTLA
jgi:hypothetical protein